MSSDNKILCNSDDKPLKAVSDMEDIFGDECRTCKKNESCIPFLAHENAMMHKDTDNERAHRTTLFVCIAFVLIVIIFVAAYTIRTSIWLDTINKLVAEIVELSCAKGFISP